MIVSFNRTLSLWGLLQQKNCAPTVSSSKDGFFRRILVFEQENCAPTSVISKERKESSTSRRQVVLFMIISDIAKLFKDLNQLWKIFNKVGPRFLTTKIVIFKDTIAFLDVTKESITLLVNSMLKKTCSISSVSELRAYFMNLGLTFLWVLLFCRESTSIVIS